MALPSNLIPLFDAGVRALSRARGKFRPQSRPWGLLLVRSGGLGDTICFSHLARRFLALAEPGEPIAFLTPAASRATTFLLPPEMEIIAVDYPRFRRSLKYRADILHKLRARSFRRVVSTDHLRHPLIDEAMIAACAAPVTEAMTARPWAKHQRRLNANRRYFTQLVTRSGEPGGGPHMLRRWADLADALSGPNSPALPASPAPPALSPPETLAAPESPARPAVVMQPYAGVTEKQPAPELCLKIIAALGADVDIVITGGPKDRAANPDYEILFARPNVRFDGRTFKDLIPMLRAARCVISADTALMHLAIAVGAPTVALCSAAYVGDLVPYPKELSPARVRFIHTPMPCEGCLGNCVLPAEAGRWPCVARLDADEAVAVVRAVMNKAGDTP